MIFFCGNYSEMCFSGQEGMGVLNSGPGMRYLGRLRVAGNLIRRLFLSWGSPEVGSGLSLRESIVWSHLSLMGFRRPSAAGM